jgi:hypothetical protein
MPKSTDVRRTEQGNTSQPWWSWQLTARYLIVQLAQSVPSGMLVWLAYAHR